MRLAGLRARSFRGVRDASLRLHERLTVVVAPNGQGKSSLLNAIEWALHGSEVAKKGCGIAERADWEVASRGGGDVEVALRLAGVEGEAELARRRGAGAGARELDVLSVQTPEGERLEREEASAWLAAAGAPDWDTWRRAVCQHQETVRRLAVESADRSAVLAALLGLESMDALQRLLQSWNPTKLVAPIEDRLRRLEESALRALRRPAEEASERERDLAALGIQARSGAALDVAKRIAGRARGLAEELGFELDVPACESDADVEGVLAFARGFAREARAAARIEERHRAAAKRAGELRAAVEEVEPLAEHHRAARERVRALARSGGGAGARREEVARAERLLAGAEEALRRADAGRKLLADARALLAGADRESCPVCGSPARGLAARIDAELAGGAAAELEEARADARERLARAREELRRAEDAARELEALDARLARARERLAALLATGAPGDALASARAELERLDAEAARLAQGRELLDARLEEHRADVERLDALGRWRAASARADAQVDLTSAPAWRRLQGAVDAAGGLAADVGVLAATAREALEELAARREAEVNRSLSETFGEITGARASAVRVAWKRTAQKISFDLLDESGGRALPVLNHASLAALSFAMLLAQASERAGGPFPWLVLDDPGQGLDPDRQRGLARAIARASERSQVVVAAPPSPLADALVERTDAPRSVVRLGPWTPEQGAVVQEDEER